MRILYITGSYLPYLSGVTVSIKNFKHELEKLGHEVVLLAPQTSGFQDFEPNVIRYPALPIPFFKDFSVPLPFLSPKVFLGFFREKFDLVHVHHPFYIGSFARLIAGAKKIPLVFTYHTRYDSEFFGFLKSRLVKKFVVNWVNNFCRKTELVIANSKFTEKYLRERDKSLSVVVIPDGIEKLPKTKTSRKEFLKEFDLPGDAVICLSVGRLSREKNFEFAIKAFALLPENFFLLIIGSGLYEKKLKEFAVQNGVFSRVLFLGKRPQEKLGWFYQNADVFVYPSFSETQGLVVFEAGSFGLPIVTVNSDLSDEVFPEEVRRLASNDFFGFAEAIKTAHETKKTSSNSIKKWADNFTSESLAKKLADEYQKVIDLFRLNQTGWQSWSVGLGPWLRFPRNMFNPLVKNNYELSVKNNVVKKRRIFGWNSWTAFGPDISEEKIIQQADWIKENRDGIPLEYLVIDDGWTRWGDWLTPDRKKFPRGFKKVVDEIKQKGLKPGIWLAPFLVEEKSELFKRHQLWLAKYKDGPIDGLQTVPIIEFFSLFFPELGRYLIDFKKPEVWDYLYQSIDYLLGELGFELIKLDFLFSPYFYPKISPREASQAVQKLLEYVKEKCPRVFVIACGCPFQDAIGLVDAMRIGPDTLVVPFFSDLTLPMNRWKVGKIKENVSKRKWTEKFWLLDPDVLVCRKNIGLREKDILSLQNSIKKAHGLVFLGDDLTKLSREEISKYVAPLFE